MGEINIPQRERDALKAIDVGELGRGIQQCLDERRIDTLRALRLNSCGLYVASALRKYEAALAKCAMVRATKKLAEMETRARRAGDDLAWAVQRMKYRAEREETEDQLFHVEDHITPPYRFSEHLTVCVSYRWRRTVGDKWTLGGITFTHDVDLRPDYTARVPKRKPSAARDIRNQIHHTEAALLKGQLGAGDPFMLMADGPEIPHPVEPNQTNKMIDGHCRSRAFVYEVAQALVEMAGTATRSQAPFQTAATMRPNNIQRLQTRCRRSRRWFWRYAISSRGACSR